MSAMDVAAVLELQRRALAAWIRTMAHASPGGAVFEREGVIAAVIPACPDRSLVNCVVFRDAGALAASLAELGAAYGRAGVRAWTVFVPDHEREAIALLEEAGHAFDGEPAAMYLDLSQFTPADPGDLDWDREASAAEVGRVNDLAYGYEPGEGPGAAIGPGPRDIPSHLYRARVGGELASVLQAIDVGGDCFITFVATHERFRGRQLASRLLGTALADARGRGLRSSTLQSSMLGRGVYERLGYGVACRLQLYEKREPEPRG